MSGAVLWQVRDLILSEDGRLSGFEGESVSGVECTAKGIAYTLLTNFGWRMQLAYLTWSTGEREVRAVDCNSAEHRMHDMCNRLRMTVYEREGNPQEAWMELSQARLASRSKPERTTKAKATSAELLEGAGGISLQRELEALGARFGLREQLLGDTGRRRSYLCMTFPADSKVIPVAAFVLTRVLPVWHRYGV